MSPLFLIPVAIILIAIIVAFTRVFNILADTAKDVNVASLGVGLDRTYRNLRDKMYVIEAELYGSATDYTDAQFAKLDKKALAYTDAQIDTLNKKAFAGFNDVREDMDALVAEDDRQTHNAELLKTASLASMDLLAEVNDKVQALNAAAILTNSGCIGLVTDIKAAEKALKGLKANMKYVLAQVANTEGRVYTLEDAQWVDQALDGITGADSFVVPEVPCVEPLPEQEALANGFALNESAEVDERQTTILD